MSRENSGDFAVAYDRVIAITEQLGAQEVAHYLIYCCGRKGTLAGTRWSKHALTRYLDIPVRKAYLSEQKLIDAGFVTKVKEGKHPKFDIAPSETGEYLWLPKTFITGAVDERPPLKLLWQTGSTEIFRLMMDYYWLTDISQEGGLWQIWKDYKSEKMGDHAQFNLIAFNDTVTRTADPSFDERYESLWEAFNVILDLGLIYEVPYLFTSEGEIVFPLINPFTQEELSQLTQAFEERMPELYLSASCTHDYCLLVPRHMTSPEVKALYIPKYRPHNQRYAEALEMSEQRINQGLCLYQGADQGGDQGEFQREISKRISIY
ncbi:MAG: hypothetical protein HOG02_04135 [Porticoccaceae bacterium]|nr:hypothetical protein [Porticoccaceae bacterium]MBT4591910.1 hypothetical protein [Porticoccaceae bacterium]